MVRDVVGAIGDLEPHSLAEDGFAGFMRNLNNRRNQNRTNSQSEKTHKYL
jgi:hypothetical protein